MGREIVKAPRAVADIESLYWNGVELFGEAQAARLHREIYRRFDMLAENPLLGPVRDSISPGVRLYFLPAPVVIAYRFTETELIILRVFHGREDYVTVLAFEH